ncbi:MAG: SGNH/GDSL hydrolase family protein [Gammaproteobacteria bacterium]
MAEGLVRVRHWMRYGNLWGIEDTYTFDPESDLRTLIPDSHFGSIRINSLGFRGPELEVPKPQGTIRFAFLGASTTYCAEVSSNEMTWPHMVWQRLQQRWPGVEFDYVNGGVPGYGASASLRNLQFNIKKLEPDVIVIYHAVNDLSGNSFEQAVRRGLAQQQTEKELSWLSRYSLLSYLVEKNMRILTQQARATDAEKKLKVDAEELAAPFRADLKLLTEASRKTSALVVLTTFAHQLRRDQTPEQQVEAAVTNLYTMPYMSIDGLLGGYESYNRVIQEVAAETGALLIGNEDSIPGDRVHFHDSVHFTDAGSEAMADRVADVLTRSGAVERLVTTGVVSRQ